MEHFYSQSYIVISEITIVHASIIQFSTFFMLQSWVFSIFSPNPPFFSHIFPWILGAQIPGLCCIDRPLRVGLLAGGAAGRRRYALQGPCHGEDATSLSLGQRQSQIGYFFKMYMVYVYRHTYVRTYVRMYVCISIYHVYIYIQSYTHIVVYTIYVYNTTRADYNHWV